MPPDNQQTQAATPALATAARLRRVLSGLDIDCSCRDRLDAALKRFEEIERFHDVRRGLNTARDSRNAIAALVDLLAELNEIGLDEPDVSVFEEMAQLFRDIERLAARGAAALSPSGLRDTAGKNG